MFFQMTSPTFRIIVFMVFAYSFSFISYTGLPAVREKSGEKKFFQGQGKVREFHQKSGNFVIFGKVREFCKAGLVAHDT